MEANATTNADSPFAEWAIIELLGHRRLAGFVRDVELFGTRMIRLDVPSEKSGEPEATQFYSPSSLYALTPTTEEVARRVAAGNRPEPVARWEFPPAALPARGGDQGRDGYDDEDDVAF